MLDTNGSNVTATIVASPSVVRRSSMIRELATSSDAHAFGAELTCSAPLSCCAHE
jgi:hypothetical protein